MAIALALPPPGTNRKPHINRAHRYCPEDAENTLKASGTSHYQAIRHPGLPRRLFVLPGGRFRPTSAQRKWRQKDVVPNRLAPQFSHRENPCSTAYPRPLTPQLPAPAIADNTILQACQKIISTRNEYASGAICVYTFLTRPGARQL